MSRLGIVVAMAEECSSLTVRPPRAGETVPLKDGSLLALCVGTGPSAASEAANALLRQGVDALVSWGCSAALDPSLAAGDLVVPNRLQTASGETLETTADWRDRLVNRLSGHIQCRGGTVLESETIVDAPSDKIQRFQSTGAVALDMESAAVARVARAEQVPFLAIRSIVDPAEVAIPDAVRAAFDPQGKLRLGTLLRGLLFKPTDIIGTATLGWRFRRAMGTLRQVNSLAGRQLAA